MAYPYRGLSRKGISREKTLLGGEACAYQEKGYPGEKDIHSIFTGLGPLLRYIVIKTFTGRVSFSWRHDDNQVFSRGWVLFLGV